MGKVIMSGIVPQLVAPIAGTPLGEIAVGSTIKLNENGSPVDYLVVNQGIPSGSSLYDASCDGIWLLRKDIKENRKWHSSNNNSYKASATHSYLNSTFLRLFDAEIQSAIVQAKIPHVNGTGGSAVASGSNGLSTKVFLLSGYEVGFTTANVSNGYGTYLPVDGAALSYFSGSGNSNSNRIAYLNGSNKNWWLRSPYTGGTGAAFGVSYDGKCSNFGGCGDGSYGIRPALILPSTAKLLDDGTIKV